MNCFTFGVGETIQPVSGRHNVCFREQSPFPPLRSLPISSSPFLTSCVTVVIKQPTRQAPLTPQSAAPSSPGPWAARQACLPELRSSPGYRGLLWPVSLAAEFLSGLNSKSIVVTTKWTKSSTAPWFQYLWEILDVRLTCEFKGSDVREAVSVLRIIISGISHRHVIDVQIRLYLSGSQSCLCRCLLYPPPRKKRRNYILICGALTYSIIKHIRNYMFYKWVLSSMINLLFHTHG